MIPHKATRHTEKKTKKSKIDMNQLGLVIVIRRPNMVLAQPKLKTKMGHAKALFRKCLTYRFFKNGSFDAKPEMCCGCS